MNTMHGTAAVMTNELDIAEAHVSRENATATTLPAPAEDAPRVFEIPAVRFADLEAKVSRLARRAAKMGVPAPSLTKIGEGKRAIKNQETGRVVGYLALVLVTVQGESPKFAGWTFLARLERLEGKDGKAANVLHKLVDTVDLPASLRDAPPKCDHCKTKRVRKDTFVVGHDDGRVLQVGSSCLADFLGHASPEALAAQCSYLIELRDALEEDEAFGRGSCTPDAYDLADYLAWVSVAIRECGGWLSRSQAYESGRTEQSTATVAWTLMTMRPSERKIEPIALDVERGRLSTEWGKAVDPTNDYLHNLKTIATLGVVSMRSAGLAASLLPAYDRELAREAERKARALRPVCNEYVGTVGMRLRGLVLECVMCRDVASDFGEKHLIAFEDAEGRSYKWWSTKGRLDVGVKYTVTGTVKKHEEYKGRMSTTISRCDAETDEEILEREARVEKMCAEEEARKVAWKALKKEMLAAGEWIEVPANDLAVGMVLAESFKGEEESASAEPVFSVRRHVKGAPRFLLPGEETTEKFQIVVERLNRYSTESCCYSSESKRFAPTKKVLVRVAGPAKPEVVS